MIKSSFLLTAASLASAGTTVTSMYMDPEMSFLPPQAGTLVAEHGKTTTYSLHCHPDADADYCDNRSGMTVIAKPTETTFMVDVPGTYHWTINCNVTEHEPTAYCFEQVSDRYRGSRTVHETVGHAPEWYRTVTVSGPGITPITTASPTAVMDMGYDTTPTPTLTPTATPTSGVGCVMGGGSIMHVLGGVAVALAGVMLE